MTLIEEWRWEKSDESPLQPLWDVIIGYVKTEFERMEMIILLAVSLVFILKVIVMMNTMRICGVRFLMN